MMTRHSKLVITIVIALLLVAASFESGRRTERSRRLSDTSHAQAVVALGHYAAYGRIKSLLERHCADAALTEATELQKIQVMLVVENFSAAGDKSELLGYIESRNPELKEAISRKDVPKLQPYTTICPAPSTN